MKFEDVKVGDNVLKDCFVRTGYSTGKSFLLTYEVVKITKTQFILNDDTRVRKSDGRVIGGGIAEYIYKIGEEIRFSFKENKIGKCEIEEYRVFKNKLRVVKDIRLNLNVIGNKTKVVSMDITHDELIQLNKDIESIKKILKID
jgi:hypothetical protein